MRRRLRQEPSTTGRKTVKEDDTQNQELLDLSSQILELTKAIHTFTNPPADAR